MRLTRLSVWRCLFGCGGWPSRGRNETDRPLTQRARRRMNEGGRREGGKWEKRERQQKHASHICTLVSISLSAAATPPSPLAVRLPPFVFFPFLVPLPPIAMGQTLPTAKLPRDIDTQFVRGPDLKDVAKDDIAGRYDEQPKRSDSGEGSAPLSLSPPSEQRTARVQQRTSCDTVEHGSTMLLLLVLSLLPCRGHALIRCSLSPPLRLPACALSPAAFSPSSSGFVTTLCSTRRSSWCARPRPCATDSIT